MYVPDIQSSTGTLPLVVGIYHSINKQFTNVNGKVQKIADLLGAYIHTTLLINVSLDKLHNVCFDSFFGSRCSGFDLLIIKSTLI